MIKVVDVLSFQILLEQKSGPLLITCWLTADWRPQVVDRRFSLYPAQYKRQISGYSRLRFLWRVQPNAKIFEKNWRIPTTKIYFLRSILTFN